MGHTCKYTKGIRIIFTLTISHSLAVLLRPLMPQHTACWRRSMQIARKYTLQAPHASHTNKIFFPSPAVILPCARKEQKRTATTAQPETHASEHTMLPADFQKTAESIVKKNIKTASRLLRNPYRVFYKKFNSSTS